MTPDAVYPAVGESAVTSTGAAHATLPSSASPDHSPLSPTSAAVGNAVAVMPAGPKTYVSYSCAALRPDACSSARPSST